MSRKVLSVGGLVILMSLLFMTSTAVAASIDIFADQYSDQGEFIPTYEGETARLGLLPDWSIGEDLTRLVIEWGDGTETTINNPDDYWADGANAVVFPDIEEHKYYTHGVFHVRAVLYYEDLFNDPTFTTGYCDYVVSDVGPWAPTLYDTSFLRVLDVGSWAGLALTGRVEDPSRDGPWTVTVDWQGGMDNTTVQVVDPDRGFLAFGWYNAAGTYTVSVTVTDAAGITSAPTTATVRIVERPRVMAHDPDPEGLGPARVTFNVPLDATTVNGSTFSLRRLVDPLGTPSWEPMPGSVAYAPDSRTAYFMPGTPLLNDELYEATLGTAITSADGFQMAQPFSWFFRTPPVPDVPTALLLPAIASTVFEVDTAVVSCSFSAMADGALRSEQMDPDTLNEETVLVHKLTGGLPAAEVSGTVAYDEAACRLTFTPEAPLAFMSEYEVTLTTGITSAMGVPLAEPVSWRFCTATSEGLIEYLWSQGLIPTNGMKTSLIESATNRPLHTIRAFLDAEVQKDRLSGRTADLIMASIEAKRAKE